MSLQRLLMTAAIGITTAVVSFADDVKKPTIMMLPSDNWCTQRYFTQSFDNQGTTAVVMPIAAVISKR